MGGGMLIKDCHNCNGKGYNEDEPTGIDKNSTHYKEAIRNIKALDNKIDDKQAEKIFDDEYAKLDTKEVKRGRPKKVR
jgi:hypothetical protein